MSNSIDKKYRITVIPHEPNVTRIVHEYEGTLFNAAAVAIAIIESACYEIQSITIAEVE